MVDTEDPAKRQPHANVDAWSHDVDGFGMRGEVEADVRGWPGQRAALTVAVGAKSSGYLAGFAMDSGRVRHRGRDGQSLVTQAG